MTQNSDIIKLNNFWQKRAKKFTTNFKRIDTQDDTEKFSYDNFGKDDIVKYASWFESNRVHRTTNQNRKYENMLFSFRRLSKVRLNATDCKSVPSLVPWFESKSRHNCLLITLTKKAGE